LARRRKTRADDKVLTDLAVCRSIGPTGKHKSASKLENSLIQGVGSNFSDRDSLVEESKLSSHVDSPKQVIVDKSESSC